MAQPDNWDELCLVSLYRAGDTTTGERQFAALITGSIEINEGDYPGESIPNAAGGRQWKQSPQEDHELVFNDLIPLDIGTNADNEGLDQFWNGVSGTPPAAYDTTEPMATDSSWPAGVNRVRDKFRVSILWSNDPAVTSAAGATAISTESKRIYCTDCRIISHKDNWSPQDGYKASVTFKAPAMNKAGTTKTLIRESGVATALSALGAYS